MVTRGRPDKRIPAVAKSVGASAVHVSADFTPFGRRRDDAVRAALGDIPLEASGSPYLVTPGRVVKGDGEPYKVFTPFYDAWRKHGWRGPAKSGPEVGEMDRPGRPRGRSRNPRHRGRTRSARRREGSAAAVEEVRERRSRRLRRRPQPARFVCHQPDVGAPQIRHDPPAHLGHRPRPRQGRAGLPAGVGISRFLRRGAQRVARQCVVELEQELRHDGAERGRRRRRRRSRPGRPDGPGSRSSTPVCVSSPRPAGCTTGCG